MSSFSCSAKRKIWNGYYETHVLRTSIMTSSALWIYLTKGCVRTPANRLSKRCWPVQKSCEPIINDRLRFERHGNGQRNLQPATHRRVLQNNGGMRGSKPFSTKLQPMPRKIDSLRH